MQPCTSPMAINRPVSIDVPADGDKEQARSKIRMATNHDKCRGKDSILKMSADRYPPMVRGFPPERDRIDPRRFGLPATIFWTRLSKRASCNHYPITKTR